LIGSTVREWSAIRVRHPHSSRKSRTNNEFRGSTKIVPLGARTAQLVVARRVGDDGEQLGRGRLHLDGPPDLARAKVGYGHARLVPAFHCW
jgi:hypothetical protein